MDLEDTSSANLIGGHGWGGSVPDFLSVLEGRMMNPIPALAAARNVAVCEAAFQAAASGQAQSVARFAE